MRAYYDSRDSYFKSPFGAVKTDTEITFRIKVYEPIKALKVFMTIWKDAEKLGDIEMDRIDENSDDGVVYETKVKAPKEGSLMWYHFRLENFSEKYYYSNNDAQVGGVGKFVEHSPISYQQTVYKGDETPDWFKEGIVYQIFPDRFSRGSDYEKRKDDTLKRIEGKNHAKVFVEDWYKQPKYNKNEKGEVVDFEFYGGTLKGIEEKIGYLKELGVTAIYLNPIFEARSNHRYDTGDYMKIDSLLGDEKSFKSLVKTCEENGIKIILDGVFSHQGADSIYFNKYNNYDSVGAYNSKDSEYFNWYNFSKYPDEYECWWGVKELPNTKEMEKTYLDFICKGKTSVIKHWMKTGIAGFRLDVADELPDEFIQEIRKSIDAANKDNILIGEVWEDATNKVSYDVKRKYFVDATLKSVTNYPFMRVVTDFMKGNNSPNDVYEFFYKQMENYPAVYFNSNFNVLGSHDRVRILTKLADAPLATDLNEEQKYNYKITEDKYMLATSRLKALSVIQYTVPGTPVIYYGDEAGMLGYDDPYNRGPYPWGKEDKGLIEHYKMLGRLRSGSEAIKKGDFRPIIRGNHTFGFERNHNNEKVIVLVNRGIFHNEGEHIEIATDKKTAISLISGNKIKIDNGKIKIDLNPLGYEVIKL